MKQHIHHPDRDEVLEFEVPDDAVYLVVNGNCPACSVNVDTPNRRVIEIDAEQNYYKCVGPGYTVRSVPVTQHFGLPPVRWYVRIFKDGESEAQIETPDTGMVVRPRVIDGGEYARSRQ